MFDRDRFCVLCMWKKLVSLYVCIMGFVNIRKLIVNILFSFFVKIVYYKFIRW